MLKLIKNEFIKIFKRKNIYVLLLIGVLLLFTYNFFQKIINSNCDIMNQYKRALKNDKLTLENYDSLKIEDSYEDIIERMALEKYALDNNIKYNILLNSQNSNAVIPTDARILLMQLFDKFDIAIIFIVVYLSSTIISEEVSSGTIKNLLTKPHTRLKILFCKIITSIFVTTFITLLMIFFQFVLRWNFIWI